VHDRLRRVSQRPGVLHTLVLIGCVLMVALHGVIGTYGLVLDLIGFVLDLIGFVLFLLFVLLSSAILLREPSGPDADDTVRVRERVS
jgi:uncharacterized Tic20 family protein